MTFSTLLNNQILMCIYKIDPHYIIIYFNAIKNLNFENRAIFSLFIKKIT